MKTTDNQDFGVLSYADGQPAEKRSIPATEGKGEGGSSKMSSKPSKKDLHMIYEKARTHRRYCTICENKISEERLATDFNEPFCCDRCKDFYYGTNALPRSLGIKFTKNSTKSGLKMNTGYNPSFLQKVMLYDKNEGLLVNFASLKDGRVA